MTVRLADDRAELEREAAALAACAARDLGAPAVLAGIELDRPGPAPSDGHRPLWALVTPRPTDASLPDVIGRNRNDSDDLLVGFADHHADLHDRTAGAPPAAVPVVDPAAEVERIDVTRYAPSVAWLRAHTPVAASGDDAGRAVLCHGGYQPLCVYGPGPDTWDALDGAYDAAGSPFAVTDRGPLPAQLRDQLARYADLVMRA